MSGSVKSGSSGDTGSNLPEVDVTSKTSMKVWDEIKDAVSTITGDSGKAAYSPSTGTITVTAAPDIVRRVEAYLNQQNSMRLRRVAIAVKIISVTTSDALSLTGSLTGIIEQAFDTATVRTVGDATSGLAIGVLKAPADAAEALNIEEDRLVTKLTALKNVEHAAITHSGALITLSDQPAPLQVGRQISYLKRTSSTSGDTGGSVSLEPGTINTGLMMTVLPRIVDQNKILMRLSVAITDAQKPFPTFGSGSGTTAVQIQLPEVDTTGFLQNAVVTSGETMILAGFEKDQNSSTEDGSPVSPLIAGGTKAANRSREVTIMMITAEILPEDPITVIGN
jgi:type IVB pilus formation R64 PilN family outer membrane protein